MGVIRNAANTLIKGRVGQTTYYISGGQQIARQSRNDSNYGETARRSYGQQERRIMWANLVNFYKASAIWMAKAFETKKRNQTDYNKFMQVNMDNSRIALTKGEAAAGACVVDELLISQGSLPSIEIVELVDKWRTNILVGNLSISSTTTVGEFTQALLANNGNIREGMQLSFVAYQQTVDPLGTPRVGCRCYEVTLNSTSTEKLRDYLPALCSSTFEQYLCTSAEVPTGGFAYILSELVAGSLRVSTQQLVVNNTALVTQYTTSVQKNLAIHSYGLDSEVILSPNGTTSQQVEPALPYISRVWWYDSEEVPVEKRSTSAPWPCSEAYQKTVHVVCNNLDGRTITGVVLYHGQSLNRYTASNVEMLLNDTVTCNFGSITESDASLAHRIEVTLSDDTILTMQFNGE